MIIEVRFSKTEAMPASVAEQRRLRAAQESLNLPPSPLKIPEEKRVAFCEAFLDDRERRDLERGSAVTRRVRAADFYAWFDTGLASYLTPET